MVKVLNSNEFAENVENTKGVVVVDFSATWCGPCKMLAPVFEGVSNKMGDRAKFFKVDVDLVKEKYDEMIDKGLTPIKRWGQPEDVANAVSVLCSGMLAFSTGEVLNVDGGFHIRRL